MAYVLRGKRVAYDNIAVGSIAGVERTNRFTPSPSDYGGFIGQAGRGISNISNASLPGVEDTDNATADKLTSDGETVAD